MPDPDRSELVQQLQRRHNDGRESGRPLQQASDDEKEFVHQLQQTSDAELINYYIDLIATYSAPPPTNRRNAIEIAQRELERRSNEPED